MNMKEDVDLFKIYDRNNILLSVLNINNMIPVSLENIEKVNYKNIEKYRTFESTESKKMYIYLLQIELLYLSKNVDKILKKSTKLYHHKQDMPLSNISVRTCDFKKLEEKCIEYKKVQTLLLKLKYINSKEQLYYIYDNLDDKSKFEKVVSIFDSENKRNNILNFSKEEINNIC